ncbi:hypothetical protein AK812_SmicGene34655 [Symbiodinium microadriaticum]|uniref:Uncharacterized protein n=1 Tax=Symbiodinium microadriaticum TaxID=2951 RepID=A0A1Q9CNI2_SYMMI|nr:hypothetical protein AK812_SmicGene34655 [Symbiodinium microadriaticum]
MPGRLLPLRPPAAIVLLPLLLTAASHKLAVGRARVVRSEKNQGRNPRQRRAHPRPDHGVPDSCDAQLREKCEKQYQALARAQPSHRREAIQLLSLPLRRELLWLMESLPSSPTAATAARPVPDRHGTPAGRGFGSGSKLCWMQGPRGLQKEGTPQRAGLWTVRTAKGQYHAARLTVGGVVIATRATRCIEEARRLRRRVASIFGTQAETRNSFESCFRTAIQKVGCGDLGLSFRVVLDLRPWVGKKVQSPSLPSAEAALALRGHLAEEMNRAKHAENGNTAWDFFDEDEQAEISQWAADMGELTLTEEDDFRGVSGVGNAGLGRPRKRAEDESRSRLTRLARAAARVAFMAPFPARRQDTRQKHVALSIQRAARRAEVALSQLKHPPSGRKRLRSQDLSPSRKAENSGCPSLKLEVLYLDESRSHHLLHLGPVPPFLDLARDIFEVFSSLAMVLPPELQVYAENILRRFPEEFMVLGAPNLEEIYDLRPNGTWSRKMVESSAEKTIEITLRRWQSPAPAYPQAAMGGYMPLQMQAQPWPAAMAAAARASAGVAAPAQPPMYQAPSIDDQAAERLGRLENALLALKPQIEAIVAKQLQPGPGAMNAMANPIGAAGHSPYDAQGDGKAKHSFPLR